MYSRCFAKTYFTDANLLAAAARTTVCVEQEANRERQLAAADLLAAAARTTVCVEQEAKLGAAARRRRKRRLTLQGGNDNIRS